MPKVTHEVRDGLYGFIEFDDLEKKLIDSAPCQRLRCAHQLAICYQFYPGATHTQFPLEVAEVTCACGHGPLHNGFFS